MRKLITPLIFFSFFTAVFGFNIIFRSEVLFTGDNFDLLFPQKHFWINEIKSGRIPLWNPYILSGTPYLADINLGTFSPVNLVYLLISPIEKAGSLIFIIEFFLVSLITYFCARYYRISEIGAIISGLSFSCSGIMLNYVSNLAIFNTAFFIPLVILLTHITIKKKTLGMILILSTVYAIQILSGHAQITFYTGLLMAAIILLNGFTKPFKKILIILLILVIAVGLSAVQLIPFLEFTGFTPRINQGYQWATQGSLAFKDIAKFIFPKFMYLFTGWTDFSAKVNLGYIGIIPFVLVLFNLFSKKTFTKLYFCLAISAIIIALGNHTPVYGLVYMLIPGFSSLRYPSQAIVVYSFAASVLAGSGFDCITDISKNIRVKKRKYILFILGFLSLLLLVLIYITVRYLSGVKNLISLVLSYDPGFKSLILGLNFLVLVLFILLFIYFLLNLINGKTRIAVWGILTLIMLDLSISGWTVIQTARLSKLSGVKTDWLPNEGEGYRIYTLPPKFNYPQIPFSPEIEERFTKIKQSVLSPNQNIYVKFNSLDGYSSMAIASFINLFTDASKTITGLGGVDPRYIDFAKTGVKYVIAGQRPNYFDSDPSFYPVNSTTPFVYSLKDAVARFSFDNSRGDVYQLEENSKMLMLYVSTQVPAKLLVRDVYYPGWLAFIDNKPVSITKFEGIYRSINMPAGKHIVLFEYHPWTYDFGKIISLGTFGITIFLYMFFRSRKLW